MTHATNPVGWFEIPVDNMPRAKAFYAHTLAIELQDQQMGEVQMAWFPMLEDGYGTTGSLVAGERYRPSADGVMVYFSTPDLDAALTRAGEAGGQVVVDKTDIGEYGVYAVIQDSEGNRIGLHTRNA